MPWIILVIISLLLACSRPVAEPDAGARPSAPTVHDLGPLPRLAPLPPSRPAFVVDTPDAGMSKVKRPAGAGAADPKVTACIAKSSGKWANVLACLTGAVGPAVAGDAGAPSKHVFGSVRPTPFNPAWTIPHWYYDAANVSTTASDDNDCVSNVTACRTGAEIVARWQTLEPILRQDTTITSLSADGYNPATGQMTISPHVQNGAQFLFEGTLTTVQSGTLAGRVAKNTSTGQVLTFTLGAGLTTPALVTDTNSGSTAWLVDNVSGNNWTISQPYFIQTVPYGGASEANNWTNGDSYTVQTVPIVNVRWWKPSWEDLIDTPDTRPMLRNVALAAGLTPNLTDEAPTKIDLDGSVLVNVAMIGSGSVQQTECTHGSRCGGVLYNYFTEGASSRHTIMGLAGGSSSSKSLQIYGGVFDDAQFLNVGLNGALIKRTALLRGTTVYDDVDLYDTSSLFLLQENSYAIPLQSTSALWGHGTPEINSGSTLEYNAPASTHLLHTGGYYLDDFFQIGNAFDNNFNPGQWHTGISLTNANLDSSIASGGFGGQAIGWQLSMITSRPSPNLTPSTYLTPVANGGTATGVCGAGNWVQGGNPFTCTNIPLYAVPVSQGTSATSYAAPGTANWPLLSTGPSTNPVFAQLPYSALSGAPLIPGILSGSGINVTFSTPNYTIAIAAPISVANGGTGDTSLTTTAVLLGEGTSAVGFAVPGTARWPLVSTGVGNQPAFSQLQVADLGSLPVTVGQGGTGDTTLTTNGVLYGQGTSAVATLHCTDSQIPEWFSGGFACSATATAHGVFVSEGNSAALGTTTAGSSGQVLTSNGASSDPTWQTAPVSSVSASGAGLTCSPTTGAVVCSNTGVTSAVAGTGISVSGATGAVTITNSLPFTPGADLAGSTSTNQWVQSISGNAGAGGTVNIGGSAGTILSWKAAQTNAEITQDTPVSDVATHTMTIQSQAAEAAAATNRTGADLNLTAGAGATTNGTGGNINLSVSAPTGTGTRSAATVFEQGVPAVKFQNLASVIGTGGWAEWLGTAAAPSSSNFAMGGDNSTNLSINAPQTSSTLYMTIGGATPGEVSMISTGTEFFGTSQQFGGGSQVIGLANATTTPTTNPSGGGVLYESGGAFEHRGAGGADEQTAGAGEGSINTQLGRRRRRVCFLRTTNSTLATMCTYTMPASGHTVLLEIHSVTTNQTTIANSGSVFQFCQFSTNGTTATLVGTSNQVTATNSAVASLSCTPSGNTVQIQVQGPSATADSTAFVDIYEN